MTGLVGIEGFVERYGDRAADVLWEGALAMADRAIEHQREDREHARFRTTPRSQLRHLRQELAEALSVARLSVAVREAVHERDRDLNAELAAAAAAAGRQGRRERTREAERVRRIKGRIRRLHGREATEQELYGAGGYFDPTEPLPEAEDVPA
jgi:hypothetical protein